MRGATSTQIAAIRRAAHVRFRPPQPRKLPDVPNTETRWHRELAAPVHTITFPLLRCVVTICLQSVLTMNLQHAGLGCGVRAPRGSLPPKASATAACAARARLSLTLCLLTRLLSLLGTPETSTTLACGLGSNERLWGRRHGEPCLDRPDRLTSLASVLSFRTWPRPKQQRYLLGMPRREAEVAFDREPWFGRLCRLKQEHPE